MFGYEVDVSLDTQVEQPVQCVFVILGKVFEMFGLHDLLHHADAVDAPPEVQGVAEVVEGDGRVIVDVGVEETEVASRDGSGNLCYNEASLEYFIGELSLAFDVGLYGFLTSLLWGDCGELPNLV